MPRNAPYCLSKGGMRMLTRQAGIEFRAISKSWTLAPVPWPPPSTPQQWPTRKR